MRGEHEAVDVDDLAARLVRARETASPIPRPSEMTKIQASHVKRRVADILSRDGDNPVCGYKVSVSRTWGALNRDAVLTSPAVIRRAALIDPIVETEAVLVATRPLSGASTTEEIIDGTRVVSGIEVADSRWEGWTPSRMSSMVVPTSAEFEADNALSSVIVLGTGSVPTRSLPPLDTALVRAYADDVEVASGKLDYVMGHPAAAVRWLLSCLGAVGMRLEAGQFVSTGNPYPTLITVPPEGGRYRCHLPGVPDCEATFV